TTYGFTVVQVVVAPGSRVVAGQEVAPTFASVIATAVIVCAPVLVTANEYAIRSPASTRPLTLTSTGEPAVLTSTSVAVVAVGVEVDDAFEVTVVPAGL